MVPGVSEAQNMASSYVVDFRRSFFFLSFLFIHERVQSDFTYKPIDSQSLVNESTYFNCSSNITAKEINWYHHPVGVAAYQRKSVYSFGKFYGGYEEDFVLDKISTYRAYNLVIKSVKPGYAGQYECQEDGGYGSSAFAQLIVIDDEPECNSNISPDGVIGHNTCGIPPDELHLSCSISFHGNIPPDLKWIKLGESDSISGNVTKGQAANRFTYNLTIKADLLEDKSSYVCQTTKSRTAKHSCISETVKLLYVFNAPSISVRTVGEVVSCSANTSSQSCQYNWKWYNGEDALTVSDNRTLKLEKEGQHRCEATCSLRNTQCVVNASLINATIEPSAAGNLLLSLVTGSETTGDSSNSSTAVLVGVLLSLLVVVIIVVVFLVWCQRRRNSKQTMKEEEIKGKDGTNPVGETFTEEEIPLIEVTGTTENKPVVILDDEQDSTSPEEKHPDFDWHPEFLHVESLKSSDDQKPVISGLAVLGKELFVVCENNSLVKVFQAVTFSPVRSFSVMDLDNPLDMVSSPIHRALFISSQKEIFKIDASGKVIVKWLIDDGGGTLYVTHEQTVLLSVWKISMLREYSADGKLICEVKLPSGVCPFHAVKTGLSQFVVSYDHGMKHLVAKFDTNGTTIQTFSEILKFPKYLAVNSEGCIFVVDRNNNRVLMMDPALESSKVLLRNTDKLVRPLRICLDQENSRMFVADSKADNPRFIVFRLCKHKTGGMGDNSRVISDNDEEEFLDAGNTSVRSQGANQGIAVNEDRPLESNSILKGDSVKRKRDAFMIQKNFWKTVEEESETDEN